EGHTYSGRPVLLFRFQKPQLIKCLCVRFQLSKPGGSVPAVLRLGHRIDGEMNWSEANLVADGADHSVDFWITDVVREFELAPQTDGPSRFVLHEIVILD